MPPRATLYETVALFLLLFPLALLGWRPMLPDESALARYAVADALARYGRWDIEAVRWLGEPVGVYGTDGLLYARQPPGVSLLAMPLAWLGLGVPEIGPLHTALLLPPLLYTLTGLFLYHSARRLYPEAGRESALTITLLWALSLLRPGSKDFGSAPASAFALVGAFYALFCYRASGSFRALLACGGFLGLALLSNPATSLALPLFALLVFYFLQGHWVQHLLSLSTRRRSVPMTLHAWRQWIGMDWFLLRLSLFVLPLLLTSTFYLWYSWQRFGRPASLADWQGGDALIPAALAIVMLALTPFFARAKWRWGVWGLFALGFLLAFLEGNGDGTTTEGAILGAETRRPQALMLGMLLAGLGAGSWAWRRQGSALMLATGALLITTGLWLLLGDLRAFESPPLREALAALPEPLPPGAQLWYEGPELAPLLLNQIKAPLAMTGFASLSEEHLARARARAGAARAPIYLLSEGRANEGVAQVLAERLFFVDEQRTGSYRLAEYWQGPLSAPLRLEQSWSLDEGATLELRDIRATPLLSPGGVLALELRWHSEEPLPAGYPLLVRLTNAAGESVLQQREAFNVAHWQTGRVMVERRALRVPASLAPGRYTLRLAPRSARQGHAVSIVVTVR